MEQSEDFLLPDAWDDNRSDRVHRRLHVLRKIPAEQKETLLLRPVETSSIAQRKATEDELINSSVEFV